MATLLLVRHGLTAETGKRLSGRRPGIGLTEEGRSQAEAAGRALERVPLAAVYTSPVQRCRETARLVAAPHGLTPVQYRSLIEVDYGSWTGRSLGHLRRTKLWRRLDAAPSRVVFPGGERLGAVQGRAVQACEEIAVLHEHSSVVLVSHGDVIAAVLAHYLGMPTDLYRRLRVAPASISRIELPVDGPPAVSLVNHVPEVP